MKKILILFLLLMLTCSCESTTEKPNEDIDYSINMDTNFIINDCLEDGENKKANVTLSEPQTAHPFFVEKCLFNKTQTKFKSFKNNRMLK